jgi:hypothetical protein
MCLFEASSDSIINRAAGRGLSRFSYAKNTFKTLDCIQNQIHNAYHNNFLAFFVFPIIKWQLLILQKINKKNKLLKQKSNSRNTYASKFLRQGKRA